MADILVTYSGYALAVLAGLFGLSQLQQRIKADKELQEARHKYESAEGLRERRYKVYVDYISKLDELNSKLMQDLSGELIVEELTKMFNAFLDDPNDKTPIRNFMVKMNTITANWGAARTKALEELNALRLTCSQPILQMLNEYEVLTKELLESLSNLMKNLNFQSPQLIPPEATAAVNDRYERLRQVTKQIEHQMRIDVGAESEDA